MTLDLKKASTAVYGYKLNSQMTVFQLVCLAQSVRTLHRYHRVIGANVHYSIKLIDGISVLLELKCPERACADLNVSTFG